jgi:hypothetical protein
MSGYLIYVQAGFALSASWRHPEMLKLKIAERVLHVNTATPAAAVPGAC